MTMHYKKKDPLAAIKIKLNYQRNYFKKVNYRRITTILNLLHIYNYFYYILNTTNLFYIYLYIKDII